MFGKKILKEDDPMLMQLAEKKEEGKEKKNGQNTKGKMGHTERVLQDFERKLLTKKQLKYNFYPKNDDPQFKDYISLEPRPAIENNQNSDKSKQKPREYKKKKPEIRDLIFAIDCEMVKTNQGLELARCSVVDYYGETVYDSLSRPTNPIENYNTRFSGITEELLSSVTTRLADVQSDLKKFLYQDCILIGHSLENDLHALKLIHTRVIDTSVLFMTSNGIKLPLKQLGAQYLKLRIQDDTHDSIQDACVTMGIAKLKIEILDSFHVVKGFSIKEDLPGIVSLLEQNVEFIVFSKKRRIANHRNHPGIFNRDVDLTKGKKSLDEVLKDVLEMTKFVNKSVTILELNMKKAQKSDFLKIDNALKTIHESNANKTALLVVSSYGRSHDFEQGCASNKDKGEIALILSD